jgi:hypothetical protein
VSHQRLAAHAVAAGDSLDDLPYVDQYTCDGCGKSGRDWQFVTRVQGQTFRAGAPGGYINADLCSDCWTTKPISAVAK